MLNCYQFSTACKKDNGLFKCSHQGAFEGLYPTPSPPSFPSLKSPKTPNKRLFRVAPAPVLFLMPAVKKLLKGMPNVGWLSAGCNKPSPTYWFVLLATKNSITLVIFCPLTSARRANCHEIQAGRGTVFLQWRTKIMLNGLMKPYIRVYNLAMS